MDTSLLSPSLCFKVPRPRLTLHPQFHVASRARAREGRGLGTLAPKQWGLCDMVDGPARDLAIKLRSAITAGAS